MIKAIIYDMDGVVVLSESTFRKIFVQQIKKGYGVDVDPEEFRESGNRWESNVLKVLHKRGIKISEEEAKKVAAEGRDRYAKEFGLSTNPGWMQFTKKAKAKGIKIALGTNGSKKIVHTILSKMKLDIFDAIVTFDDVEQGKPSPDIYLKCASLLNVPPDECVVFEDSLTGVMAAKRAGMKVIALTTSMERNFLLDADRIIDNFHEIDVDEL